MCTYHKHPEDKLADRLFHDAVENGEMAAYNQMHIDEDGERALENDENGEIEGYTEGADAEGQEIMVPYYKKDTKKATKTPEAPVECPQFANGCYTILNTKSGEHRTFQIKTARKGGLKGKRIVSMLTGSDNNSDYTGFGFLTTNGINVWNKHKTTKYAQYALFFWQVLNGKSNPVLEVKTEKHCARCNRLLTNPVSIDKQVGPECAKYLGM